MPPRQHVPGQRSDLWILDLDTGQQTLRHRSSDLLIEAPNWTADGWLIVNGDGKLFRLSAHGDDEPQLIETAGLDDLNNDHVLDPDGQHIFVSNTADKHIHRVPLPGVDGEPVRMTADDDGLYHFLHGVSPDGRELAWIGLSLTAEGTVLTNIHCSQVAPAEGLDRSPGMRQITDDAFPDDGSEYSPDGQWLWFNSERGSSEPGHAQIFRAALSADGGVGEFEQLTFDERVNWFPHISPDGTRVVYISFPPGTLGHPENKDVVLRELLLDGEPGAYRDLVWLPGGQGTINVNSWAPDSRQIAYVSYPIG